MQKYYVEQHLADSNFDKRDISGIILVIMLVLGIVFLYSNKSKNNNVRLIESYYVEKFYKVPSKKDRFENTDYEVAVSKLLLEDSFRSLKYRVRDLNSSLTSFQNDLLKQQAMNDIILMLKQVKSGDLNKFDIAKMQQAVLEAGYGNIDSNLLAKAISDYQYKVQQEQAFQDKILKEKLRTEQKMKQDSKEAAVLASDIAREIAEDEIENFIENLSMIARVGHFVVQKVNEE